jgi:hypothetical protein
MYYIDEDTEPLDIDFQALARGYAQQRQEPKPSPSPKKPDVDNRIVAVVKLPQEDRPIKALQQEWDDEIAKVIRKEIRLGKGAPWCPGCFQACELVAHKSRGVATIKWTCTCKAVKI